MPASYTKAREGETMSDVSAIAAASAAQASASVAQAINIKVLKLAQDQQQSVATLLESAVESAAQIASGRVDLKA
jgi:uncharacterized protein YaeQ